MLFQVSSDFASRQDPFPEYEQVLFYLLTVPPAGRFIFPESPDAFILHLMVIGATFFLSVSPESGLCTLMFSYGGFI
jgi:hypothetical protein